MNFFLYKLNQRIELLRATGNTSSINIHYQSRLEFLITYALAYLWNKNFEKKDVQEKENLFSKIILPSIGSVVDTCRSLDIEKEIFNNKKIAKSLKDYPNVRNSAFGHGFTYEDNTNKISDGLISLYDVLMASDTSFFSVDVDIILVCSCENNLYKGVRLSYDGNNFPWSCPSVLADLKIGNLYMCGSDGNYFRLSPFLHVENFGEELYVYNRISEKLQGRLHYNRLISTNTLDIEWEEFASLILSNDGIKIKTSNGTVRNIYTNNYNHYIDVGIKKEVESFLDSNRSSVCATIWGHGGIGKTATIQAVCDYFCNKEFKTFDYIIFISAKDRKYNYYKGCIEIFDAEVSTFTDVIKRLNKIVFEVDSVDTEQFLKYTGKIMLVIDDYESFAKEEAEKITQLIKKMDINHHKVVITTRAASYTFGLEIKSNELNEEKTCDFLLTIFESEHYVISEKDKAKLADPKIKKLIHKISSGRPLFIFQLSIIIAQKGLSYALNYDIKSTESAVKFLYGRLYDYLSKDAQDLFVVIGMLVSKDDMMNVMDKAKYILNMETREDAFISAVEELKKLKIIKVTDDGNYFEVYSKEILDIMVAQLTSKESSIVGGYKGRLLQINKDKNADIEESLLLNANASRLAKSEIEAVESYKQLINRSSCPNSIKVQAVLNLTSYLVIDKGKRSDALDYFERYSHLFICEDKYNREGRNIYAQYILQWALTLWGNGTEEEKQKSIAILSDYYKGGTDYSESHDLKIASTLLMYRSILLISEWRQLKDQMYFKEVTYSEYKTKRKEQLVSCEEIHKNIGHPLYTHLQKKKLVVKKGEASQYIFTAFYNYIEVLVRLKKFDFAMSICNQVIETAPHHFLIQFQSRKHWITQIKENKDKQE